MRDIKFRAWDAKEKRMLEVNHLFNLDNKQPIEVWTNYYEGGYRFNPNKSELMQYAGLKDMNGVEIYEGDIVNVTWSRYDTEGENYAIAYDPNNDGYSAFDFVDWYEDMNGLSYAYIDGQITVIGNRFENPELLEVN